VKRLIAADEIAREVAALGAKIAAEYHDRPLTILGVLTGSIVLLADLIRAVDLPLRVGLIQASSYRGRSIQPGDLSVDTGLVPDIADRDVLLIDDIFDTGRTLAALAESVRRMRPRSLRSAVLLWKEERREVDVTPDYYCFRIPDVFVVGYGLDYNDEYRHLPYIASLEEHEL
jgi:hypoxanthine phosphoribosyltransferase